MVGTVVMPHHRRKPDELLEQMPMARSRKQRHDDEARYAVAQARDAQVAGVLIDGDHPMSAVKSRKGCCGQATN
jgi:hypothetical protein